MFHDINSLLITAYELEGLLSLARDRGNETPQRVYEQIRAKIEYLNSATAPSAEEEVKAEATAAPQPEPAKPAEPEATKAEAEAAEGADAEAEVEEEITKAEETETPAKPDVALGESASTEEREEAEAAPEDEPEDLNRVDMQQAEEDEMDSAASEAETWESHHSAEIAEAKSDGAELRKYFTLNDRFRYRRELWGGSDVAYQAGIAQIASMKSLSEVKRYLIEDLEQAPDSPEVADFLELVAPYFQSRH